MWCLFKQEELNNVVIDVEILAIGDKEHCISKAYDDYNNWNSKQLTLDEIEQRLDENKLSDSTIMSIGLDLGIYQYDY